MFPDSSAAITRNDAGEPTGWDDTASFEAPYDPDMFLPIDEDDDTE